MSSRTLNPTHGRACLHDSLVDEIFMIQVGPLDRPGLHDSGVLGLKGPRWTKHMRQALSS